MRILHILDPGLPLDSDHALRIRGLARAQMAKGWEVAYLTGPELGAQGQAPGPDMIDGITCHRPRGPVVGPGPFREWRQLKAMRRQLAAVAEAWHPDLAHVHSPASNLVAALPVAKRLRLPLIYEARGLCDDARASDGADHDGFRRDRLNRAFETHAARRADAVAVSSEALRRDLIARGIKAETIIVAPDAVDAEMIGAPRSRDVALARTLGLVGTDVVGFIGAYRYYEGVDDLIAAMPPLLARRPNVHLLLVGHGPMEARLKAQADTLSARARICFVDRVPQGELRRYYSLVDIVAYPRKRMRQTELVTPIKPLEAMVQRKLVAASDVGGNRELIEDGVTGTLFPADDPMGLADTLDKLFADRACWEKQREAALRFVTEERNWSSTISRYIPVYQKLTGKAL